MLRRAFLFAPSLALAQGAEPLRLIVPFAPGGPADLVARLLAPAMGRALGQAVVVDSRSGAGGVVGVEAAARARPDGNTVVLASTGAMAVLPHLMPRLPYDPLRDLAPVALVLSVPQVLAVPARSPSPTLAALLERVRREPGRLSFGSAGAGSSLHLAGELLKQLARVDIVHVPYRGAAPAVTDLLAGAIELLPADLPVLLPHLRAGTLRAPAVADTARAPLLPEVPTAAEAGLPGWVAGTWYGLLATAGTPAPRLAALHDAALAALADPATRAGLEALGGSVQGGTSDAFAAFIRADTERWGAVIRAGNIRLE